MSDPIWLRDPRDEGVAYPLVHLPVPGLPGRLFVGPIPGRLRDRLVGLHLDLLITAGVQRVLCLVPADALRDELWVPSYEAAARSRLGDRFDILPIADFGVPPDERAFARGLDAVRAALADGEQVLVHCAAGCGRTGLFACCLLVRQGLGADEALAHFHAHRGCGPETDAQRNWVRRFAGLDIV